MCNDTLADRILDAKAVESTIFAEYTKAIGAANVILNSAMSMDLSKPEKVKEARVWLAEILTQAPTLRNSLEASTDGLNRLWIELHKQHREEDQKGTRETTTLQFPRKMAA
jgi:hypothetical protein